MAKFIPDTILDLMLDQAEGTQLHVCNAQPTTYADLASMTLAKGAISAPTAGAGSPSGRENAYPAVSGMSITQTGTATHVALSNNTSILYLVTTCTNQALTTGGTVDTTAFTHTLTDPS
jgi:hypothetical protein